MVENNARRIFASLVAAAYVDGLLTDDERLVLHRKATELAIPIRDMNEMISQGERGQISLSIPTTDPERLQLLESMIDVVCADGRIEAPEHHLLAKVASHLKMPLSDLRQKVKNRMDQRGTRVTKPEAPARQTRAMPATSSPRPMLAQMTAAPAPLDQQSISQPAPPPQAAPAAPLSTPGPIRLDAPKLIDPVVADLPPVTLQLLRQSLAYESEEDTSRTIERTLGVPKEEARRIIEAILQAYPELRRRSGNASARPR